ncbi:MAG: Hdr-like menaquinol oxidoreductase cytochrome c subunit [Rhodobacteraceae bacterium]|nr:Hdr-like menaquinol oxidoreductase cytochrome c subunit [Paracoccaceae bacterium]
MLQRHNYVGLALLIVVVLGMPLIILASVPVPEVSSGQGKACVEDTDFMRRNHMTLLLHQRDDTMIRGIRSGNHSLNECVDCHATNGEDAVPVTAANPRHFCRSCHDYAAVKIDCFECHASRPDAPMAKADGR